MASLLIVDDESSIQHAFRKAFREEHTLLEASTRAEAIAVLEKSPPDVIVLDVRLPDATGLETYTALRERDRDVPIILITGHGTTELAIEAMKHGAFDYLIKPLELPALREKIDLALRSSQSLRQGSALTGIQAMPGNALLGKCSAMQEVYKAIGRVTAQDVTVLIQGESGTGKELVARAIYQHSTRADKPFLAINCGAIPENLIETELFGHEKGAFTSAERKKIGKFEQVSGGTLLLDEIGELPPHAQVKLLRVLQEQQFERVGGNETLFANVRVIAATNADLEAMSNDGRFRKDLFFRLNVFQIHLPPLRERGEEDLRLLIAHFLRQFQIETGRTSMEIDQEAMQAFLSYPWPGNVRELQSVIRQSLLQTSGNVLLLDFVPSQVRCVQSTTSQTPSSTFDWDNFVNAGIESGTVTLYAESLVRMEREVIVRVLRHTKGNQLQAARILGITRGSLRTKIRTLGITIDREIWTDSDQTD